MPVDTPHPAYTAQAERWRTLRDVVDGDRAIKAAGPRYLPQPKGLDAAQYQAYLARPSWYAATRRTVLGLRGAAFRQAPVVEGADSFSADLADVTGTGMPLVAFAKLLFLETLTLGRYGALVDWADGAGRPYWCGYAAEQIINWRVVVEAGHPRLTLVVLQERHEAPDPDDDFVVTTTTRYRELRLTEGGYRVRLWAPRATDDGETAYVVVDERFPTRRGQPLDFLPFTFVSPSDVEADLEDSPVQDLVDLNLRHWRRSAGYEHGLYLTGLPMLVVTGHNPDRDAPDPATGERPSDITLGSQEALTLVEPEAKAYFLEFQGQGLDAVRQALDDSKAEMAVMGARLLEEQPRVNETATAVQLRQAGDASVLRTLMSSASAALTRLLRWDAWWRGVASTPQDAKLVVALNQEVMATSLSPMQLQVLMTALQEGAISYDTWWFNLTNAGFAEPGVDAEMERARLEAGALQGLRDVAPDDDAGEEP